MERPGVSGSQRSLCVGSRENGDFRVARRITARGITPGQRVADRCRSGGERYIMLMSDMAVRELEHGRETFFDSCRRVLLSVFGRTSNHRLPSHVRPAPASHRASRPATAHSVPLKVMPAPRANANAPDDQSPQPWRRHPQLRKPHQPAAAMPVSQRSARLEAERGMILARGGKLAEAVEAFTTAASDQRIDLAALPGFWDLPRQGMMSAVRAYEQTKRFRDAAALEARIRHTLRPRSIRPMPAGSTPDRMRASGD